MYATLISVVKSIHIVNPNQVCLTQGCRQVGAWGEAPQIYLLHALQRCTVSNYKTFFAIKLASKCVRMYFRHQKSKKTFRGACPQTP